jgi:hypothetical protein
MKFGLNKRQSSRKPPLGVGPESEEMRLTDAPNREQTGRIVVSALYHLKSLTQDRGNAILVNSWMP